MGAAVSIDQITLDERARRHPRDSFLPELLALLDFESISDDQQTASIDDIVKALTLKTDVFLTHNWGVNQENHKVVERINELLQKRKLITWFDTQRMYVLTHRLHFLPRILLIYFFVVTQGRIHRR